MKLWKLVPAAALAVSFTLPSVALAATGAEIFTANKCNTCHTVKSKGIAHDGTPQKKAPDLSKVGAEQDKKFFASYLLKKVALGEGEDAKKHPKKFAGSVDDLKVLATWLESLK